MRKYYLLMLFLILFLGFVLRFYKLGEIPAGLHKDEAYLGYNAYSILKTGNDISGIFLPLHLESFLYSPAGYSYISIPFIKIFDLNTFSVRFASALFSVLTLILTYFLVRVAFKNYEFKQKLAFCSTLLISFSPWNINLARTATENVIVVFFIVLGVILYLYWLDRGKNFLLLFSFLSFTSTIFIYQAPRAFLPFFIPLLIYSFYTKKQKVNIKTYILFFLILIVTPLFFILSSKELSLRIRTVSIFSGGTQLILDEQLRQDGVSHIPITTTRFFHNKLISYSSQISSNYFQHFSYDFLFQDKGFPDRYRVPLASLIYLFELPLLIFGIYRLIISQKKIAIFLIGWILLAPIGSALTFDDVPNLQRTILIFPAFSIISGFGLVELFKLFKSRSPIFIALLSIFILIAGYNVFSYFHQYYVHYPLYRPWYRNDGYKELVLAINANINSYKKAIITNRESAPTIFFLFYNKYDPAIFQKETKNSKLRDFDRVGFAKYKFSEEECPVDPLKPKLEDTILYVNSGLCKNVEGAKVIKEVRRADNSAVFTILSK